MTYTGTAGATELAKLNNGDNVDYYTDTTKACQIKFNAPTGNAYILDQVQVFLNGLTTETARGKIASKLKL